MASFQSFLQTQEDSQVKEMPLSAWREGLEAGSAGKQSEGHHRAFARMKEKGASSWEAFELCKATSESHHSGSLA